MKKLGLTSLALVAGSMLLLSSQAAAQVNTYDINEDGSVHIDDVVLYMKQAQPNVVTRDSVLQHLNEIQPAFSETPSGTMANVTNETELRAALADSSYETIRLLNNIQVSGDLLINRYVTLIADTDVTLQAGTFSATGSFAFSHVTLLVDVGSDALALKKAMMSPAQSVIVTGIDGFSGRLQRSAGAPYYFADGSGQHVFPLYSEQFQAALSAPGVQHIHLLENMFMGNVTLTWPDRQVEVSSATPVTVYVQNVTGTNTNITLTNVGINMSTGNAVAYATNPGNGGEFGTHRVIYGGAYDIDGGTISSIKLQITDSSGNYLNADGEAVDATPIDLPVTGTNSWSFQVGEHGFAPGTYTLRVSASDGAFGTVSTATFTVVELSAVYLSIDGPMEYVMTGNALQFNTGWSPYDASADFEWQITDGETRGQISQTGLLTAQTAGRVVVNVKDNYTGVQTSKAVQIYDSTRWQQITAAAQAAASDDLSLWENMDLYAFVDAGFQDLDDEVMPAWLLSYVKDDLTALYAQLQPIGKWTPAAVQAIFESYVRDVHLQPFPTDSFTLDYSSAILSSMASKEAFRVYKISDGVLSEVPLESVRWIDDGGPYRLEFVVEEGSSISALDRVIVEYNAKNASYPLFQEGDPSLIRMPSFMLYSSFMPPV